MEPGPDALGPSNQTKMLLVGLLRRRRLALIAGSSTIDGSHLLGAATKNCWSDRAP
jgi:hypothetical protein